MALVPTVPHLQRVQHVLGIQVITSLMSLLYTPTSQLVKARPTSYPLVCLKGSRLQLNQNWAENEEVSLPFTFRFTQWNFPKSLIFSRVRVRRLCASLRL
ncbi:hypothetical protein ATANTOWER_020099 [Ataeniobius toweri]|uniref:Uncharacterized protein n=1 Tax=Ataeniobius toweri TaxID=208326 RepID=A0ABU7A8Q1_9TELE|nr:hypothetical protein [Ataeniobius toweri]